jgi:prepilin-type N-terminal cleavage/methylation domain-containing protein
MIFSYRKHQTGFTLIELLVVISIIGVLASVALVRLDDAQAAARDAQRVSEMRSIMNALAMFYADHTRYPGSADGVPSQGQMIGVGLEIDDALEPYMGSVPRDPLHDAGNGAQPATSSLYFYSYDPAHWDDQCDGDSSNDRFVAAVFGFNYSETGIDDRQTCKGPNMRLHDAAYNRVLNQPTF